MAPGFKALDPIFLFYFKAGDLTCVNISSNKVNKYGN